MIVVVRMLVLLPFSSVLARIPSSVDNLEPMLFIYKFNRISVNNVKETKKSRYLVIHTQRVNQNFVQRNRYLKSQCKLTDHGREN